MRSIGWLLAVVVAGCYSPSIPNGVQQCGTTGACPTGYQCAPNNHCFKIGQLPTGQLDMSVADAPMGDLSMGCTADSCKGGPKPLCDATSKKCVECLADANCPSGKVCMGDACVPGCSGTHGCPDGGGACDPNSKMCKRCGGDQDCGGGTPRCDLDRGVCVECLPTNDNCTNGKFCGSVNGVFMCQTGCADDKGCVADPDGGVQEMKCCNHVCVNTLVDGANCGGCAVACGNEACCAGFCSDTSKDLTNCGTCANSCAGKHATWMCTMSNCAVTGCAMGFGDCNSIAADGCEATLASDVANCSMCGNKCMAANANMACTNSMCTVASCLPGFGNCNNQANDGCEINTASDVNNCSGCATKCTVNNGTPACVASKCVVGMCNAGFADCDMMAGNGCEVNINSDATHCGGCNTPCGVVANATVGCAGAKCTITACTAGFADCDGNELSGCEINITNNVNNCNGCGKSCPATANATGTSCAASACHVTACAAGFGDCNGLYPDGCEINTTNNPSDCGVCGKVCPINQACINSVCVPTVAVTFSFAFAAGVTTPAACGAWNTFRGQLTGVYSLITIKGSNDPVGVNCPGASANVLCQAIHNSTTTGPIMCNGRTWQTGFCGACMACPNNMALELTADPVVCSCDTPGYTVRPCIDVDVGNGNWGGDNTATCGPPAQTLTVVCQ